MKNFDRSAPVVRLRKKIRDNPKRISIPILNVLLRFGFCLAVGLHCWPAFAEAGKSSRSPSRVPSGSNRLAGPGRDSPQASRASPSGARPGGVGIGGASGGAGPLGLQQLAVSPF